ncbi:MAG: hypothetical protein KAF27_00470 [Porphyrobacter sp.]|nr:hypothetical protein [Porphyrobacter sp.]
MNSITSGANLRRNPRFHAVSEPLRPTGHPAPPYAFLTARALRGLVAAMVD